MMLHAIASHLNASLSPNSTVTFAEQLDLYLRDCPDDVIRGGDLLELAAVPLTDIAFGRVVTTDDADAFGACLDAGDLVGAFRFAYAQTHLDGDLDAPFIERLRADEREGARDDLLTTVALAKELHVAVAVINELVDSGKLRCRHGFVRRGCAVDAIADKVSEQEHRTLRERFRSVRRFLGMGRKRQPPPKGALEASDVHRAYEAIVKTLDGGRYRAEVNATGPVVVRDAFIEALRQIGAKHE